jgi:hypothetical protein
MFMYMKMRAQYYFITALFVLFLVVGLLGGGEFSLLDSVYICSMYSFYLILIFLRIDEFKLSAKNYPLFKSKFNLDFALISILIIPSILFVCLFFMKQLVLGVIVFFTCYVQGLFLVKLLSLLNEKLKVYNMLVQILLAANAFFIGFAQVHKIPELLAFNPICSLSHFAFRIEYLSQSMQLIVGTSVVYFLAVFIHFLLKKANKSI